MLPIAGDAVELQHVVINLALNALDAASASGTQRRVTISTRMTEPMAEIAVSDSGPGLPAEVQDRLFEPFFSTKAQGLGMGLVIVRSIVERHKGRVRAENGVHGGASFRVSLPLARALRDESVPPILGSAHAPYAESPALA